MPDDVATLEQANLDTDGGELEESDAAVEETEELDYKAAYEKAQEELAAERVAREKQERGQRARDIQLLSQKQKDEIQAEIARNTKTILAKLSSGTIDLEEAEAAIVRGTASIQDKASAGIERETFTHAMVDTEGDLRRRSVALGTGAGLEDARAQNILLFWNEAVQAHRAGKFDVAEVRRNDALREMQRLEDQLKANPRSNGLSINERGARGTGAGASRQSLVNDLASGKYMSPSQIAEAGKAMDEGIMPNLPKK